MDGFGVTVPVTPGQVTYVDLPMGVRMGKNLGDFDFGDSGIIEQKGVEVTSEQPIAVYGLDFIVASNDAYMGIPVSQLGNEYVAVAYHNEYSYYFTSPQGTQVAMVAAEDDTRVTITPAAYVSAGEDLPYGAAQGVPFTITLNKLETFQIGNRGESSYSQEDLTGTIVTSDKPISVYGGNVCTTILSDCCCDHVVEQMPPVSALGVKFVTVPLAERLFYVWGDLFRVAAAYDDTQVKVGGEIRAVIGRGQYYQFKLGSGQYEVIETSKPAILAQYALSSSGWASEEQGDPFMMLVPPVERYESDYTVGTPERLKIKEVPPTYYEFINYINLAARVEDTSGFLLDGQPLNAAWHAAGDPASAEYAGTQVAVGTGSHTITHVNPAARFMAWVYGYQLWDSYGYPAGMKFGPVQCAPSSTEPGDGVDNDCDGVIDEEQSNGADDDGDGLTDEDLAAEGGVNHAPETFAQTLRVREAGPFLWLLSGSDPDGDAITFSITRQPGYAAATIVNGRFLSYPRYGYDTLEVVASDGRLTSAPATITVTPSTSDPNYTRNNSPGFSAKTLYPVFVEPGGSAVFNFEAHAYDVDLDPLAYTLEAGPPGMTIDAQTGRISWLVTDAFVGDFVFQVRASDDKGASAVGTWTARVRLRTGNRPPVITSTPPVTADTQVQYSYQVNAYDPEGDAFYYELLSGPAAMVIDDVTGLITWTPGASDAGEHRVVVRVVDAERGMSSTQSWVLRVAQSALTFTSTPPMIAIVDTPYSYQPAVTDSEPGGGQLTYSLLSPPAYMHVDAMTGLLTWTPSAKELGVRTVHLRVQDELGNSMVQHFQVEVMPYNVAPHIMTAAITGAVLQGLYLYDVDAADSGVLEVLRYSLTEAPVGMEIDAVSGVIQWIPSELGSYPVTVRVTDLSGATDTQSYLVEVSEDENAPVVTLNVSPLRLLPGQSTTISVYGEDQVAVTDLSVTVDSIPLALDANNQAVYTAADSGVHEIVAAATDPAGNVGY